MKKLVISTIIIFAIILCEIIPSMKNSYLGKSMPLTSVTKGWQYHVGDSPKDKSGKLLCLDDSENICWNGFNIPGTPPIKNPSGNVWLRIKLPEKKYRDPSLYFYTFNQNFQIFMDGKLIYKFGDFNNEKSKRLPGSFWHIIEIPETYSGKFVYIKMNTIEKENTGLVRDFQISSKSNLIIDIIEKNILSFILASMFLLIGVIALFISVIKIKGSRAFLYFSLCCITAGVWLIAEGSMKQFFFYAPSFWEYIKIISQYLMPATFGLLVDELLKRRYTYIFSTIAWFYVFLVFISLIMDFTNIMPVNKTIYIYYAAAAISMFVSIGTIMKSYSYWNKEIKIFITGFALLCCFALLDILNWNLSASHSNVYLTQWGIFIFLTSFCIVIIFHYLKAQDDAFLASEELRSKEKSLIESKQQIEFFANISHELRTPLNIILSTIQLLKFFIDDGSIVITGRDTSNYFDVMKQNCYRLLKLVNNIIDINRIDSGYLEPKFENRDIVLAVEDITQSAANYIKARGMNIIFDTNVEEKVMACDLEKIERIVLNFLSNAVKFSKPGGSIFVNVKDMGQEVVISVEDTGIGIKDDKLNKIFERFVQVDKSFTRNHEGSGIGLSLVKELVEMQGGHVSVQSVYGKGSIFSVTLPAKTVVEENEALEEPEIKPVHVEKVNIEFSDIYS